MSDTRKQRRPSLLRPEWKVPPPPPPPQWFGDDGIVFTKFQHKQRYDLLVKRHIRPGRFLDFDLLDKLGLTDRVIRFVKTVDFDKFIRLSSPTYPRLVLEFLSTYETRTENSSFVMQFRCFNVDYTMNLADFSAHLGLKSEGFEDVPKDFDDCNAWNTLANKDESCFPVKNVKASDIVSPVIRIVHRWIAHNFTARGESTGAVTREDLFVLWCIYRRLNLNAGRFLAERLRKIARVKSGEICLGWLISYVCIRVSGFEEGDLGEPVPTTDKDKIGMTALKGMSIAGDGPGGPMLIPKARVNLKWKEGLELMPGEGGDEEGDTRVDNEDVGNGGQEEGVLPPSRKRVRGDAESSSETSGGDLYAMMGRLEMMLIAMAGDVVQIKETQVAQGQAIASIECKFDGLVRHCQSMGVLSPSKMAHLYSSTSQDLTTPGAGNLDDFARK